MKKLLFLLLMLSCLIMAFDQANAQSARIAGKVLDVTGKGVAGVKVAVEGRRALPPRPKTAPSDSKAWPPATFTCMQPHLPRPIWTVKP